MVRQELAAPRRYLALQLGLAPLRVLHLVPGVLPLLRRLAQLRLKALEVL